MALDITKLEKIGGGVRSLFIYDAGADAASAVAASAYFNGAVTNLKPKDVIMVIGSAGTTIDNMVVSSAYGALPVTVASAEGITAT